MNIEELESRYMELFWAQRRSQWENYVDEAHHDLCAYDEQIFELLSPYQGALEGHTRWKKVLNAIISRACVDSHPQVAPLRNRLDDRDNYAYDIESIDKRGHIRFRQLLSGRMREDVLQLMRQRQCLARRLGYGSYPELVLWSEDSDLEAVRALLSGHIKRSLPVAAALAKGYGVKWSSWTEDLASVGYHSTPPDPARLVAVVLQRLGLDRLNTVISIVAKEQAIWGYAGILSVPDDIRILVKPITDLGQELTLYHELGHAIAHALNREAGIFTTWTSSHDEAMAVVMERIAALIVLDDVQRDAAQELWLLDDTRCATSALFELDLWDQPDSADELYLHYYGAWDIGAPPAGVWAADSFRSVDPVYIQHYVLAARVADLTVAFLQHRFADDFGEWGRWLAENYYADGRRRSLADKCAVIGGIT
jgi:hypothetical protein